MAEAIQEISTKKDLNILIKEFPKVSDNIINTLALMRGMRKWEIIREALIEYADRHQKDIAIIGRIKRG